MRKRFLILHNKECDYDYDYNCMFKILLSVLLIFRFKIHITLHECKFSKDNKITNYVGEEDVTNKLEEVGLLRIAREY